jgi:hypothetical protein
MEAEVTSVGRTTGCKVGNGIRAGLIALARINFAVIEFPGPVLGVILGLPILGLGVAKGIETLQAGRIKTRGAAR